MQRGKCTCVYLCQKVVTKYHSFMAYLNENIKRLESQTGVNAVTDQEMSVSSPVQTFAIPGTQSPDERGNSVSETHSIRSAANEVEYLSLTAMSGPDIHGQSAKQHSFLRWFIHNALTSSGSNPTLLAAPVDVQNTGSARSAQRLEELRNFLQTIEPRALTEKYMIWTAVGMPFVPEEMCLAALTTVLDAANTDTLITTLHARPEITVVAYSVIFIVLLMSSWTPVTAQRLPFLCQQVAEANFVLSAKGPDTTVVHCLVLQAFLSMFDPTASSCWHILGLAMTNAISLGLHQKHGAIGEGTEKSSPSPLFWTLYVLDRTLAFTMDLPFGIEDSDISLDLPVMLEKHLSPKLDAAAEALQIWNIHYAHMLSEWRRDSYFDIESRFFEYRYWRTTQAQLTDQVEAHIDRSDTSSVLQAILRRQENQFACRALVQLVILGLRVLTFRQLGKFVGTSIRSEVPNVITSYVDCAEKHKVCLSFVDAYDLFGAILLYICFQREPRSAERLMISDVRLVTNCMDVLQTIAGKFPVLMKLKDLLWDFLECAESGNHQKLEDKLVSYELQIPGYLKKLMNAYLATESSTAAG